MSWKVFGVSATGRSRVQHARARVAAGARGGKVGGLTSHRPNPREMMLGGFLDFGAAGQVGRTPDSDADAGQVGEARDQSLVSSGEGPPDGRRQARNVLFARAAAGILEVGPEGAVPDEQQVSRMGVAMERLPRGCRRRDFAAQAVELALEQRPFVIVQRGRHSAVVERLPATIESRAYMVAGRL